jgi:type II secretory ATPase GspE/PulE/Tfp pilus assembly ATPase PilB-like protein
VEEGKIKEADKTAQSSHIPLVDVLVENGQITPDILGQAAAEYYKIPYADLNSYIPAKEQVLLIPEETAKKYRLVVFKVDTNSVTITTDEPAQKILEQILPPLFKGKKIRLAYSVTADINNVLGSYRQTLETRFAAIIKEQKRVAPQIFEEMLIDALSFHSSDMHLEPAPKDVVVRFRVDGVLHEAGRIPKPYYENILNRIKVQAHLRIDEHFAAQDGSVRVDLPDGGGADLRVSIVPTLDGEKVAIRILSHYVRGFTLADLGLSDKHQQMLVDASNKPFGMILVVGPTGSGKTTTLYALLKSINNPELNVTTIEDPVEYRLTGINQIQVNMQTNLTFAKGLRSIVRQDPDIILVGEIRDQETVEIAVNAALTGHLLFSTFHANDAATAIPRLLDMGAEPFLVGSTVELIIAQRLVRRICDHCRASYKATAVDLKKNFPTIVKYLTKTKGVTLYKGKGCSVCGGTGYKGRVAIYEFLQLSPELKDLILKHPSSREIWTLARRQGARSMFEDGIEKVLSGLTTVDELLRVAPPPDNL